MDGLAIGCGLAALLLLALAMACLAHGEARNRQAEDRRRLETIMARIRKEQHDE